MNPFTREELETLRYTLEEAQRTDEGNHWLPQDYAEKLRTSIAAVRRELARRYLEERRSK